MTPDTSARRLMLLRHAKSQWPDHVPDRDRPLAERGIADATVAGPILAGLAAPVDLVLCSPAVRARQTWNLAAQAFAVPPPTRYEPVIYGAEAGELLELFRSVPEEVRTVLLVGHEPTLSSTAELLAGAGSAAGDLARLRDKYPTCALATFQIELPWAELGPKRAVLEQFQVPRG